MKRYNMPALTALLAEMLLLYLIGSVLVAQAMTLLLGGTLREALPIAFSVAGMALGARLCWLLYGPRQY
jgi:hypothetical protein